jgi:hypothetical protein
MKRTLSSKRVLSNRDAVSQSGELMTLAQAGIASISVTATATSIDLGNGNTQPFSGTFTRTDGTQGNSGAPELSGSLLLASNNFYREFNDNPALTEGAKTLPQMGGSCWARDLREAMSRDSSYSRNYHFILRRQRHLTRQRRHQYVAQRMGNQTSQRWNSQHCLFTYLLTLTP